MSRAVCRHEDRLQENVTTHNNIAVSIVWVSFSVVLYILAFFLINRFSGWGEAIPSIIPVVAVAWRFGFWPGLCAAILSFPVNIFMCSVTGVGSETMIVHGGITGTLALVVIGTIVGRIRDLGVRLREELKERERTEQTLRKSEERFRRMAENIQDGLVIIENNRLIYANERICDITGYSREEFLAMRSIDLVASSDRERVGRVLDDFKQSGAVPRRIEFYIVCKDGSRRCIQSRWSAKRESGVITGYYIIITDVTEHKRFGEEREQLVRELQAALAQVKTLSGFLPICSNCKKIRDDRGYWNQLEQYIQEHSEAEFSHSICPECAKKLYPDLYGKIK